MHVGENESFMLSVTSMANIHERLHLNTVFEDFLLLLFDLGILNGRASFTSNLDFRWKFLLSNDQLFHEQDQIFFFLMQLFIRLLP